MSVELLASIDLFSFLTEEHLRTLDRSSRTIGLPAGDSLFSEGDEGEEVFIIVEGLMRIHRAIAVGADRTLAELGAGAMFGEASIIDRDLRSASATAVVETQLLVLDADQLQRFMLETPDVGLLIMGRLAGTLRGVISQTLLKKVGGGRVAAMEVLTNNTAVSANIRDGKTHQIPLAMQTGGKLGMVELNTALLRLVDAGEVVPAEAYRNAIEKDGLERDLKKRGDDVAPPTSTGAVFPEAPATSRAGGGTPRPTRRDPPGRTRSPAGSAPPPWSLRNKPKEVSPGRSEKKGFFR